VPARNVAHIKIMTRVITQKFPKWQNALILSTKIFNFVSVEPDKVVDLVVVYSFNASNVHMTAKLLRR